MSEENSVSSENSALSPAEFNFTAAPTRPRRNRARSFKPRPAPSGSTPRPLDSTPSAPSTAAASPQLQNGDHNPVAIPATDLTAPLADLPERAAHVIAIETAPIDTPVPEDRPTRPATLYYSAAAKLPPKTGSAPAGRSPSFTAGASDHLATPTVEPAPAARPASSAGYRQNIERQTREQKSFGSVLSTVVYLLVVFILLGSLLAGYGLWALSQQLRQQSLTLAQLDQHYAAETQNLAVQLKQEQASLAAAQASLAGQGEVLKAQQEELGRLRTTTQAATQTLREETSAQASELAMLRTRIHLVERGLAKIQVKAIIPAP